MQVWLSGVSVGKPLIDSNKAGLFPPLYPSECRERGISYKAKMQGKLNWRVNNGPIITEVRSFGSLPIMVRVITFIRISSF
jgi:DNA-directed RNA polymerase I subunit RPA2